MSDGVVAQPTDATNWVLASNIAGSSSMTWYLYDLNNNNLGAYTSINFGPPTTACTPSLAMNSHSWWVDNSEFNLSFNLGRKS